MRPLFQWRYCSQEGLRNNRASRDHGEWYKKMKFCPLICPQGATAELESTIASIQVSHTNIDNKYNTDQVDLFSCMRLGACQKSYEAILSLIAICIMYI